MIFCAREFTKKNKSRTPTRFSLPPHAHPKNGMTDANTTAACAVLRMAHTIQDKERVPLCGMLMRVLSTRKPVMSNLDILHKVWPQEFPANMQETGKTLNNLRDAIVYVYNVKEGERGWAYAVSECMYERHVLELNAATMRFVTSPDDSSVKMFKWFARFMAYNGHAKYEEDVANYAIGREFLLYMMADEVKKALKSGASGAEEKKLLTTLFGQYVVGMGPHWRGWTTLPSVTVKWWKDINLTLLRTDLDALLTFYENEVKRAISRDDVGSLKWAKSMLARRSPVRDEYIALYRREIERIASKRHQAGIRRRASSKGPGLTPRK